MQNKFTDNLLKGFIEFSNNDTPLKPILQPLSIWPETNFMLDEFYSRPNIKIGNDKRGIRIKNSMRHTVGSAREYKNNPALAKELGILKERRDLLLQPLGYMWKDKSLNYPKYFKDTINDTGIDLQNNRIGRKYIKQNPKATNEDIMQYAYNQALNNYERQYAPMPILKAAPTKVLNWNGFGNLYYTYEDKPQMSSAFSAKNDGRYKRYEKRQKILNTHQIFYIHG